MATLAELHADLQGDRFRVKRPFEKSVLEANALLHNPAARLEEIVECLRLWCKSNQPCMFGRVAAHERRIHFCVLTADMLSTFTDDEVRGRISDEKKLWKQRALTSKVLAAHSFVVVAASHRVAYAAPDKLLRRFSDHLLDLAGWGSGGQPRHRNAISSDFLYLRNPQDQAIYGFQFNVDFFAAAGDGRWWHDHRFPGGVAFTANSVGHMRSFREWYGRGSGVDWSLVQAMQTIKRAEPMPGHQDLRLTWLEPLDGDGRPFLTDVPCPLPSMPAAYQGLDWTRYGGFLHTDHAVRAELFEDRDGPPDVKHRIDLTYLHSPTQEGFLDFTQGRPFTEEQVFAEVGRPETWEFRSASKARPRTDEEAETVALQMRVCERWEAESRQPPIEE